jgi:branched-chain amino acid aminotransferase
MDKADRVEEWVWFEGHLMSLREVRISPLDRGFLYGDGLFTTLRAESGRPLYMGEHLARLAHSMSELRISADALRQLEWPDVLGQLLRRNGLRVGPAAVKIVITRGVTSMLGLPEAVRPTIFIQARPYRPPGPDQYGHGWRLRICRKDHAPPLARHKSLNYLYYLMARQDALDAGADEAVILDAHGHVTETAAGSLLVRTGGGWWTPRSPYQLPGVTLAQVVGLWRERGQAVETRAATPEDLYQAETIWVLNSLMGIMPARSVDDHELPGEGNEEAPALRKELFRRGAV